jgi:hypothetical protein
METEQGIRTIRVRRYLSAPDCHLKRPRTEPKDALTGAAA